MDEELKIAHIDESKTTAGDQHDCQNLSELKTTEEAVERYKKLRSQWRNSPCRNQLLSILQKWQGTSPPTIKNAVSFAIGSVVRSPRNCISGRCRCLLSFNQLVIFLDVVEHGKSPLVSCGNGLAKTTAVKPSQSEMNVYAQDPAYTELDTALLQSLGVKVLEDPAAQSEVDCRTFVFAPFFPHDCEILAQCFHRQPCLFMANEVDFDIFKMTQLRSLHP